jgi:hypothetical protein
VTISTSMLFDTVVEIPVRKKSSFIYIYEGHECLVVSVDRHITADFLLREMEWYLHVGKHDFVDFQKAGSSSHPCCGFRNVQIFFPIPIHRI